MSEDVKIIKDKRQWVVVAFGHCCPFDRKADAERARLAAIHSYKTGRNEVRGAIKAALDIDTTKHWL